MLEAATVSQFSSDVYCSFTFQHIVIEVKLPFQEVSFCILKARAFQEAAINAPIGVTSSPFNSTYDFHIPNLSFTSVFPIMRLAENILFIHFFFFDNANMDTISSYLKEERLILCTIIKMNQRCKVFSFLFCFFKQVTIVERANAFISFVFL